MRNTSRRTFLGTATASAGAVSLGNISGCSKPSPEKPVENKMRNCPLDGIERENIKITDVRVTLLSDPVPKKEQWFLNWMSERYKFWKNDCILTQVFTDKGIVGIGGTSQYAGPERVKKFTEDRIKPLLLGKNPFDVQYLNCVGRLWAGADAALWDIIGKAKNMPVYKLLAIDNKPNTHIPIYASAGEMYEGSKWPEDLIAEAFRHKENGFNTFKFRTGHYWKVAGMTLKKYITILEKLREAVGPDFRLVQEAGSGMGQTVEEIVDVLCPVMEELHFYWLEEPMRSSRPEDVENYLKINEALPTVDLSGGEGKQTRFDFKDWIDSGAYDIVQNDCNVTGVTESWHITRMAHLNGLRLCPHNWHGGLTTMANAHVFAGVPNGHMMELNQTYNPMREEIFKEPLVAVNGYMDLPDKPGFGVELIDDVEKKFPFIPGLFNRGGLG